MLVPLVQHSNARSWVMADAEKAQGICDSDGGIFICNVRLRTAGMQIVPRLSAILNRCDAACYQTWGLEAWPLMETEKWSRLGRLECDLRQWSGTRAFVQLRRAEKHTLHSYSKLYYTVFSSV